MNLEMAESTMFSDVEQKLKKKNKILFSRDFDLEWASFLIDDDRLNKEKLLNEKKRTK